MQQNIGFVRKSTLSLLASLLIFVAGLGIIAFVLSSTIGNRVTVRGWVDNQEIYQLVINELPKVASTEMQKAEDGSVRQVELNQDDAARQDLAQKLFVKTISYDSYKRVTNGVIDALYSFLEGKTDTISYSLPLIESPQALQTAFASTINDHLATLPVCTDGTTIENFDAFTATCKPSEVTPERVNSITQEALAAGTFNDYHNQATLKSTDLQMDNPQSLPAMYKYFKLLAPITLVVGLFLCIVIGLVSWNIGRAFKVIGMAFLFAALPIFLSSLTLLFLRGNLTELAVQNISTAKSQAMADLITKVLEPPVSSMLLRSLLISGVVTVLGVGLLVSRKVVPGLKPKTDKGLKTTA